MPTCSPRRIEQLCFLLRREPTVRMAENLERRCSLSLKKIKNPSYCVFFALCTFFAFHLRRQLFKFVLLSLTILIIPIMSPFFTILTLGTIYVIHFHHLSSLATCVTRVYVVGDFCYITCLSNPFYSTRYLVPRKT